jgi:hypothetical protein
MPRGNSISRRSLLQQAGLLTSFAAAANAAEVNVNTLSAPSDLKITGMRACTVAASSYLDELAF